MQEFEIEFLPIEQNFEIDISNKVQEVMPTMENIIINPSVGEQIFNHPNSHGYDEVRVKPIKLQNKAISPTIEEQVIKCDEEYNGLDEVIVKEVTNEIDNNIKAENIKNGIEILGIKGNYISKYKPKAITFYNYQGTDLDYELSNLDTSELTTMLNMFNGCNKIKSLDLSNFDTSKVTIMGWVFSGCSSLESLDLSNFDTSNVTDMSRLFDGCNGLKSLNISNFNTKNVKYMANMFSGLTLTELDLTNLDISNVMQIQGMFYGCRQLVDLNLSGLDASKVNRINSNVMFASCSKLTNLTFMDNLGKGYVQKSNNYNYYKLDFSSCTSLTHESLMDVINKLYDLNLSYRVANGGTLYTQQLILGSTNMAKLTAEEIAIATNKGWTVS